MDDVPVCVTKGRKLEFSAGGQMMLFAPRNYFSATIELLSCAKIRLSETQREREMQRLWTNLNTCPATHQFLRLYIFFQVLGQSSDFSEVFQKCRYHNHHHLSKPPNVFHWLANQRLTYIPAQIVVRYINGISRRESIYLRYLTIIEL